MYSYLETNKLSPPLQSAYPKNHSTKTALLRVLNDILTTLDHRQDVVLVMLDLLAGFDTLDHNILVSRLRCHFGFSDIVLLPVVFLLPERSDAICYHRGDYI